MLNARTAYAAAIVSALGVAILLAYWVHLFAVNIPFWDEWVLSDVLVLHSEESLGLDHLLSQHNESRKLFPRLVMVLNAEWFGWDVRLQMGFSVVIALATFLNLVLLLRTSGLSLLDQAPLVLLAGLLVFSPLQAHNYLMGIQFIVFGVAWLLTTNLLIATSRASAPGRYALTALLSFVSTYTFANGMLVWLLTFPVLATFKRGERRHRLDALWLLAAGATLMLYFWDYETPGHHPEFGATLASPRATLWFLLVFLGSPLGHAKLLGTIPACGVIGAVLIAMALLVSAGAARRVRLGGLAASKPLLPWAAIALYGFGSAVVASLGRASFGIGEAMATRYVTVSIYATIGVVVLAAQLHREPAPGGPPATWSRSATGALRGALVVFIALGFLGLKPGSQQMKGIYESRRQAFDAFATGRVTASDVAQIYPMEGVDFLLARFVHLSELRLVAEPLRHYEILEVVADEDEGSAEPASPPASD